MREVVEHSFGQLRMIYTMATREQAQDKLLDLDNIAVVLAATLGGKATGYYSMVERYQKLIDGNVVEEQNASKNRATMLKRLMSAGVAPKQ